MGSGLSLSMTQKRHCSVGMLSWIKGKIDIDSVGHCHLGQSKHGRSNYISTL